MVRILKYDVKKVAKKSFEEHLWTTSDSEPMGAWNWLSLAKERYIIYKTKSFLFRYHIIISRTHPTVEHFFSVRRRYFLPNVQFPRFPANGNTKVYHVDICGRWLMIFWWEGFSTVSYNLVWPLNIRHTKSPQLFYRVVQYFTGYHTLGLVGSDIWRGMIGLDMRRLALSKWNPNVDMTEIKHMPTPGILSLRLDLTLTWSSKMLRIVLFSSGTQ